MKTLFGSIPIPSPGNPRAADLGRVATSTLAHSRRSLRAVVAGCCALAFALSARWNCRAEGIPEPSLVMYGVVYDAQGVRQTSGSLAVTIQRPGLPALKFQTAVTNINDQFSYVIVIPCETELAGFPVTATDRLKLLSTPTVFDRSTVTFNDTKILYTDNSLSTMSLTSRDRGRLERVDFSPTGASDLDSNGLLKSWEIQNFGRLGVDPLDDPDKDGMSNLAEMQAGTDPNSAASRLAFVSVDTAPGGGARVVWSSQAGKSYRILRSTEILGSYQSVGPVQFATPPANTYVDTTATPNGTYFYRITLQP